MDKRGMWLIVIVIASCKRDHPCEKLADLVDKCSKEKLPGRTIDDVELSCRADQGAGPQATTECALAKTCDELTACFTKWDCRFVLTGPDDHVPQLMCRLGPGSGSP